MEWEGLLGRKNTQGLFVETKNKIIHFEWIFRPIDFYLMNEWFTHHSYNPNGDSFYYTPQARQVVPSCREYDFTLKWLEKC